MRPALPPGRHLFCQKKSCPAGRSAPCGESIGSGQLPRAGRAKGVKKRLLADAEFLLGNDCAVAVDVLADEVVEQTATLTYESLQGAGSGVVLVVSFQVLGKVLDTDGEKGNLALSLIHI